MSARDAVAIDGLRYSYGDGRTALDGISLTVAPGTCVALVGPNGAGKSTLLLHLNGLLRGRGRIAISGVELRNDTLRDIRRRVGLVFQDPDDQLFMPTCLEDVAFGPMNLGMTWDAARERAVRALTAVGMAEHGERAPHQLSLGQRKRVAIATVLAMQPDIVALDEPTAGLDPRSRRGLIDLLRDLPATRLLATHDLAMVAELCERVIVLDEGKVVADDAAAGLLGDADLLSAHGLEPVGRLPISGMPPGSVAPHPLERLDAGAPFPERGA